MNLHPVADRAYNVMLSLISAILGRSVLLSTPIMLGTMMMAQYGLQWIRRWENHSFSLFAATHWSHRAVHTAMERSMPFRDFWHLEPPIQINMGIWIDHAWTDLLQQFTQAHLTTAQMMDET